MISDPILQWILSAVFLGTGLVYLVRVVRGRSLSGRVGDILHLLMSAAMFAMVWEWGMALPIWPQAILFALAAAWFLAVALMPRLAAAMDHHHAHEPRWVWWYHVVMMGAMSWMLLAMLPPAGAGGEHMHHGGLELWNALIGLGFLVLLLAGTALFVANAVPAITSRTPAAVSERTASVVNVLMGAGMVAMIIPLAQA